MKKVFCSLLLMLPMLLAGCSVDLDYRKAVSNNDFEKAHTILRKMEDKLNDFYENNEMTEDNWFTGGTDYSNYHKFEKLCQNQIDAICFVYGEEMKYLADTNEPNVKQRITVLYQDASNDADRIANKLRNESKDAAYEVRRNFEENMRNIESVLNSILTEE